MLQRLMAVSMTVFLGCAGLGCGTKSRSSADAAPGTGTGGTSGAGGALDGGSTDSDAVGGSAGGDAVGGSAGGHAGGGAGGDTGGESGGVAGGAGGGGGAGDPSDGGDDASVDGGPTCTPNVPCTPNLPCKTGIVSCDTGGARCVATGNAPNGTLCGTNVFCVNGFCDNEGCGHACTPTNRCHTGAISCTTGTNICQDTGTPVPDGTSCGTNQICASGVCMTSPA